MMHRDGRLSALRKALLTRAAEAAGLTARGWTRTLRLARTIADLDGSDGVRRLHVAEALIYRRSGFDTMAQGPLRAVGGMVTSMP